MLLFFELSPAPLVRSLRSVFVDWFLPPRVAGREESETTEGEERGL